MVVIKMEGLTGVDAELDVWLDDIMCSLIMDSLSRYQYKSE